MASGGISAEVGLSARPPATDAPRSTSAAGRAYEFLRVELASSPERVRATARILISCAIAVALVMALHVPSGAWVVISIFVVSLPNAGATLQKGLQRLAGTWIACATGMVLLAGFGDIAWLRVPIGGLAVGVAIFLSRTTTAPYAPILGGITFVLFFFHPSPDPDDLVAFGLWRALLVATGIAIVLVVDLVILPTDPEAQLLDDLGLRLDAVIAILDRTLAHLPSAISTGKLRALVVSGLQREIDLLSNAESRYRALRFRHPEQILLITAVERLATAVLALQRARAWGRIELPEGRVAERLAAARAGVVEMRAQVAALRAQRGWARGTPASPSEDGDAGSSDRPVVAAEPTSDEVPVGSAAAPTASDERFLPALLEIEEAVRTSARALGFTLSQPLPKGTTRASERSPLDVTTTGFLTPAFSLSNLPEVELALKAALAETLFYLLMTGLHWPEIQTGLVTVLVISNASNGAMIHKALLRITGAALGGLVAMIAIVAAVPVVTTLPGYVLIALPCFAVAAWLTTGGPRICYAGVQTGIALALTLVDSLSPTIDLTVPRDRVLGILFADTLTTVVFYAIWPVLASQAMRRSLAASVQAIADLSRSGAHLDRVPFLQPARGYRWQVYQNLTTTLAMHDEAGFEANAGTREMLRGRAAVRRLVPLVQDVFIAALAVVRHRLDVDLSVASQPVIESIRAVSGSLAATLDAVSDRLAGRAARPAADPTPLLAVARQVVAAERDRLARLPAAEQTPGSRALFTDIDSRLELLEELLEAAHRLDEAAREAAPRLAAIA